MSDFEILKKQKSFIIGVALLNTKPDKSNVNVIEVLNAYTNITGKVFENICFSCGKNKAFEEIYLYCKDNYIWK